MKFFIGTTNKYKAREIGAILNASGCNFEITDPIDPEETENDFLGNALLKAKTYAKHSQGLTISEDSGLIIPSINNLPGPWSARFSDCLFDKNLHVINHHNSHLNRDKIDEKNCELVIKMMKNIPKEQRHASFHVVLAVADHHGDILFHHSAESHGTIADELRGENGFGYDPIFIGHDTFGKTYGELDRQRKNLRSHRHHVLAHFKNWLQKFLNHAGDKHHENCS